MKQKKSENDSKENWRKGNLEWERWKDTETKYWAKWKLKQIQIIKCVVINGKWRVIVSGDSRVIVGLLL